MFCCMFYHPRESCFVGSPCVCSPLKSYFRLDFRILHPDKRKRMNCHHDCLTLTLANVCGCDDILLYNFLISIVFFVFVLIYMYTSGCVKYSQLASRSHCHIYKKHIYLLSNLIINFGTNFIIIGIVMNFR